jgi:hypothetical protein
VTTPATVSAEDAAGIRDERKALLEPYAARSATESTVPGDGRRRLRYFMAATPLPDFERGETDDGDDTAERDTRDS